MLVNEKISVRKSLSKSADAIEMKTSAGGSFSDPAGFVNLLEKLEPSLSIGRLSSGIAHNLNGHLTGLIGYLELLKMKRPELSADLDLILGLSRKLRDGIAEISSRSDEEALTEPQPQNLNQILRAELAFLRADLYFKHSIAVKLELQEPLPNVYGAYADFALSLENILLNAIDAQRANQSGWISVKTSLRDEWVAIEIEDGGSGFASQALECAFDPLWPSVRTDEFGQVRGGVGLMLARRRLQRWGGTIQIENRKGGGAKVLIQLPVRDRRPSK